MQRLQVSSTDAWWAPGSLQALPRRATSRCQALAYFLRTTTMADMLSQPLPSPCSTQQPLRRAVKGSCEPVLQEHSMCKAGSLAIRLYKK